MPLNLDFVEVFAVPNESSIIDTINPVTDRSCINDETLEQVRARYPLAERMPWDTWRQAQIARQSSPLTWTPTTAEQYHDMLNVLPPAAWIGGAFLVGEPTDHDMASGRARFQMYRQVGSRYEASSRPVTHSEFYAARVQG